MISANNISLRVGKKALFEEVNIKFTEVTTTAMMQKVEAKILKIGPGDQVLQSSGNQLLNRAILII